MAGRSEEFRGASSYPGGTFPEATPEWDKSGMQGPKRFGALDEGEQNRAIQRMTILPSLAEAAGSGSTGTLAEQKAKRAASKVNTAVAAAKSKGAKEATATVVETVSGAPKSDQDSGTSSGLFSRDTDVNAGVGFRNAAEARRAEMRRGAVGSARTAAQAAKEREAEEDAKHAGEGLGAREMRNHIADIHATLMNRHTEVGNILNQANTEDIDAAREHHAAAGRVLSLIGDHIHEMNQLHSGTQGAQLAGLMKDVHPLLRSANNALNSKAIRNTIYDHFNPPAPGKARPVNALKPGQVTGIRPRSLQRMGKIIGTGPSDGFQSKNWTSKPWPKIAVGNQVLGIDHPLFADTQALNDAITEKTNEIGMRNTGKALKKRISTGLRGTPKSDRSKGPVVGGVAAGAAPTKKSDGSVVEAGDRFRSQANDIGKLPTFEGKPVEPGDEGPGPKTASDVDREAKRAQIEADIKKYGAKMRKKARVEKRNRVMEGKAEREAKNKEIKRKGK